MGVKKTPEGFLRIPAKFARAGIYEYGASELRSWGVPLDEKIPHNAILRVHRDEKHVFNAQSMKSFEHKPVTNKHPKEHVTPETFTKQLAGMSLAPVSKANDNKHLKVEVMLLTADGIREYKSGTRQLSAGYSAEFTLKGGITKDGEPFDMTQSNIVGNHIALVPKGRAGSARLLDSKEDRMSDKVHQETVEELGKVKQQLADVVTARDALAKENEELKGKVAALEDAQLTDEELQEKIAEGVKDAVAVMTAREAIVDRALKFAPKLEVKDDMSNLDIMAAAIAAQNPKMEIAGKTEDYVRGIFDNLPTPEKKETNSQPRSKGPTGLMAFDELKTAL